MMATNGWLPKETAPKDGSWFLVLVPDSPMAWAPYEFASWTSDFTGEFYFCETDTSERIDFDWWQPLPPANPVPTRPLSSITEEEAREAFRLAFGHTPKFMGRFYNDVMYIRDWDCKLYIGQDGETGAMHARTGQLMDINAPALVDYLRSIGIAFESVTEDK